MCKATDSNGDEQDIPDDEFFNYNAMSATMWHSITVRYVYVYMYIYIYK
jgi:hypothetical protein